MPKRNFHSRSPSHLPRHTETSKAEWHDLEADVLEGLEHFGSAELRNRFHHYVKFSDTPSPGAIRFHYSGDLSALLDLRSLIAIYLVRRFDVPRPRALLGHQHFTALLDQVATVRRLAAADAYQMLRLSAAGEDSSVMSRLKDELAQHTGLRIAPDEGDLLLRLRRSADGAGWEALTRISPRPLATRAWRVCNLPGALNATLAHAMMHLSTPHPDDLIVNVACGSGTLMVERLALGPARSLLGCDIDPAALECARANLWAAGFDKLARLERWDAADLPLADGSATMICADLPFGQLVGSHLENEVLYPRFFAEATRIAAPGARLILLTHEVRLLERAATQHASAWRREEELRVRTGGMTPRVYLFRRV
jgi:ubiquinone/menaquinone biosynthesis C-methylase UbiE